MIYHDHLAAPSPKALGLPPPLGPWADEGAGHYRHLPRGGLPEGGPGGPGGGTRLGVGDSAVGNPWDFQMAT